MNNLIQFINSKLPLGKISKEKLLSLSSEKSYKKGDALLKIGGYCNHFYFINDGLARLFFDTADGEFIMRFFQKNILFTELESLTSKNLSQYQIVALEDVHCMRLAYADFERKSLDYMVINHLG